MTLQTLLSQVGTKLTETLECRVHHYYRPKDSKFPVCIWQEDSEATSFHSKGSKEQCIHGTVDYYTPSEYDSNVDLIQDALEEIMATWRLSQVIWDDETHSIHYEWEWEIAWLSSRQ